MKPDWRDPNMPVLRNYIMRDGTKRIEVDPEYERRYREHRVNASIEPNWREDPTYNLRRRKNV